MNQQGVLTAWSDDRGFGFITPAAGGERVFAHISSYQGRDRPVSGRRVVYTMTEDPQGRPRAGSFRYPRAAWLGALLMPGVWFAGALVLGFFALLAGLFDRGYLPVSILAAYGGVSLVLFLMYGIDKRAATRGAQRIAENTLHLFELCGGWPGALLAQQVFRHKTRKGRYQFVFWLAVLANLAALGWLLTPANQSLHLL